MPQRTSYIEITFVPTTTRPEDVIAPVLVSGHFRTTASILKTVQALLELHGAASASFTEYTAASLATSTICRTGTVRASWSVEVRGGAA